MGTYIVKLANNEYVEWSSVMDAPSSFILSKDEASAEWNEERIARCDAKGHSLIMKNKVKNPEEMIICNRCGEWDPEAYDNGTHPAGHDLEGRVVTEWTLQQIRDFYKH